LGPAKAPRFVIETAADSHVSCEVVTLDGNGMTVTDGRAPFKIERLLEMRRESRSLPPLLTQNVLILATGDRIALDVGASAVLEENRLLVWPAKTSFPTANAKGLSIYLPYIAAAVWALPEGVEDGNQFVALLQEELRKRDVIYLKNGDRIEG